MILILISSLHNKYGVGKAGDTARHIHFRHFQKRCIGTKVARAKHITVIGLTGRVAVIACDVLIDVPSMCGRIRDASTIYLKLSSMKRIISAASSTIRGLIIRTPRISLKNCLFGRCIKRFIPINIPFGIILMIACPVDATYTNHLGCKRMFLCDNI